MMAGPEPYVLFPGTAREALTFYGGVFGCAVDLHTFAEFDRADGPADAIAHGGLTGGPVALSGADVSGDADPPGAGRLQSSRPAPRSGALMSPVPGVPSASP